jgi:glycerate kinase
MAARVSSLKEFHGDSSALHIFSRLHSVSFVVLIVKIVIAPDSFKSSVSASECASALQEGLLSALPGAEVVAYPLADGGEGSLEVLVHHGFGRMTGEVRDAWGNASGAHWVRSGKVAVIESAQATQFRASASAVDSLTASSHGVGMLIMQALDAGVTEVSLMIGGTASTDGGIGMLQALGAHFSDHGGMELGPGGGSLRDLVSCDLSGLDERLKQVSWRLLSDVSNPLLGNAGAALMFAPQKGADPRAVSILEEGLERLATVMGPEAAHKPGGGAGGGLGFAAMVALGVEPESGARALVELVGADGDLATANLVITGEGSFDSQSVEGKLTGTIIERARHHGVPCIVVCGVNRWKEIGESEMLTSVRVLPLSDWEPDPVVSMVHARELLVQVGAFIGRELALD